MKVASFELLEFLLSPTRSKYYVIGLPGSCSETVTKANYSADQIIIPDILADKTPEEKLIFGSQANEKEILTHTNLSRLIRQHHIEAVSPDTYSTAYLERWAKRNKVRVVCTPIAQQKKYENKLFFDRFLHRNKLPVPKSRILKTAQDVDRVDTFPVVLQTPNSMGSAGTYVIRDRDELIRFIVTEKKADFPLLCREFIGGSIPIGVSILVGSKKLLFSAIRMQAYFTQPSGKSTYYGVQWMKTSAFHPTAIKKLNESLLKAGTAMQEKGFRGIAAFDIMVRDQDIYFIECNPRTGGSSPQLASQKELVHGLNFTDEYVSIMTGGDLSAHRPFIPDSRYEGFTMDIGFLADLLPQGLPLGHLKTGVYSYHSGRLDFLSSKVEEFSKKSNVFIYYVRPVGAVLDPHYFMGFLFSHFPLLEIKENQYTFSEEAKKLLKHLEDILIKK